ncbi:MAG: DUF2294 family protein [Phycisphaerae bacterium]|nr:DUF2294 family protein [Phycisphaerae bacterium]
MNENQPNTAQRIVKAAMTFQQQTTGHVPKGVSVVLHQDTLVITMHEALSPAEKDLAKNPVGAAQVEEFHRQLFRNSSRSLREEIRSILGVDVRGAIVEIEPVTGTVVQVFCLAQGVPGESWSEGTPGGPLREGS